MSGTEKIAVISADECYWSILHTPVHRTRRLWSGDAGTSHLTDLLQDDAPEDAGALHATFIPIDDSRVLACAVPLEVASRESERCTAAHPDRIPECIVTDVRADSINLLGGRFEPRTLRRRRSVRAWVLTMTAVAGCGLACAGQLRRASHAEALASREATRAREGLAERWPEMTPAAARTALDEAIAHAALSRGSGDVADAPLDLADILSALPEDLGGEVLSLRSENGEVHFNLSGVNNATQLVASVRPPEGWSTHEPRLDTSSAGALLQLTFTRTRGHPR